MGFSKTSKDVDLELGKKNCLTPIKSRGKAHEDKGRTYTFSLILKIK